MELFEKRCETSGKKAKRRFVWDVVKSFRLRNIRTFNWYQNSNSFSMMQHYIKLFVRRFQRQKLFSSINILGLSSGICTALLIYLYVNHELSYDKFHANADNIYRVNQTFIWGDRNNMQFGSTGPGVSHALAAELPEVEHITRLHPHGEYLVSHVSENNQLISFNEKNILAADSNFFEVFSFPLEQGHSKTALKDPRSLVLTKSTYKKYFQSTEPIGQLLTLEMNGKSESYHVTGIVEDPPSNSHIQFDMLMSMSSIPRVKKQNWTWVWTTFVTFVQFDEQADMQAVNKKLDHIPSKYAGVSLERTMNTTFEEYTKDGKKWELFLQPLTDIHLSANSLNRISPAGNLKIVIALGATAIFVILLSCINFMNLSASQCITRAKFTGIKKILGSTRSELSKGYIIEAFIFCLISFIVGTIAVYFLLPYFNNMIGQKLAFDLFTNVQLAIVAIGLLLFMSLLAGSYPAIFLSAFSAIDVVKGKLKSGNESKPIRSSLVVVQFTSSIILTICTLIVFQQLKFTHEKDLGFTRENLVSINNVEWLENAESFVNELRGEPGISKASLCTSLPPTLWGGDQFKPVNAGTGTVGLNYTTGDEMFVTTLDLRLLDGRNFSKKINEAHNIILNQAAIESIGWNPNEPVIGKNIKYPGHEQPFVVIGVVSDFNYWSIGAPIEPFALFHNDSPIYAGDKKFVAIAFAPNDGMSKIALVQGVLDRVEKRWSGFAASRPFEYHFVDDAFVANFENQSQFAQVLSVFAGLAIMIAFLGLFGIIIHTVEQRTKEIGVRKVVGASIWHILILLSKGHIKLILISILVGVPISFLLMENWLGDFTYRITMSPPVFILTGLCVILLALAISIYHGIRAAQANPVDTLRDQ